MLRSTLFSPSWWISCFLSTLLTMVFIVIIKKVSTKVPVLNTLAQEV